MSARTEPDGMRGDEPASRSPGAMGVRAPGGPRERRVPVLQRPATWLAIAYGAIGAAAAILLALVSG